MIDKGLIPNRGGCWIDVYDQKVNTEVAGTLTTRTVGSSNYWITDKHKGK